MRLSLTLLSLIYVGITAALPIADNGSDALLVSVNLPGNPALQEFGVPAGLGNDPSIDNTLLGDQLAGAGQTVGNVPSGVVETVHSLPERDPIADNGSDALLESINLTGNPALEEFAALVAGLGNNPPVDNTLLGDQLAGAGQTVGNVPSGVMQTVNGLNERDPIPQ